MMTHHQGLQNYSSSELFVPFSLNYNFDYGRFKNSELENRAKSTLGSFFGFMRASFDGLLENGRILQELYFDCIVSCPDGKKVFEQWLSSSDFGASTYLAKSSMEIYGWFQGLHPRMQNLILSNVQNWSVSALRQLRKVSTDFLEEVVSGGKKTAAQIKQLHARDSKNSIKTNGTAPLPQDNGTESISQVESTESNSVPELAPGMRIVVKSNDWWNDSTGVITSVYNEDEFWVLLDNTVSQGDKTQDLFKREQLVPEVKRVVPAPVPKQTYTEAELEARIAEALAAKEREIAELEQARYIEIRNAALEAAKKEIIAAEQHARYMTQQKEQLTAQLQQATEEIYRLRALEVKNKQLEQRISDLEKALEGANRDSWNNTLNKQAAKVISSQVEKTVAPLTKEVERLQNLNAELKQELALLDAFSSQQQQELDNYRRLFKSNNQTLEIPVEYICSVQAPISEKINQEVGTQPELQYH